MSNMTEYFSRQCLEALQFLEERGGPEGDEYLIVVEGLIANLQDRVKTVRENMALEAAANQPLAANPDEDECGDKPANFICTLPAGHNGNHVAHTDEGVIVSRWPQHDRSIVAPSPLIERAERNATLRIFEYSNSVGEVVWVAAPTKDEADRAIQHHLSMEWNKFGEILANHNYRTKAELISAGVDIVVGLE